MRSLIIADIHSNVAALEAVVADAATFDEVICVGDVVLNGPHPAETMDLLMGLEGIWIMSNHDREILAMDPHDESLHPWSRYVRAALTEDHLAFMRSFVETTVIERDGLTLRLHHGDIPTGQGDRIWPDSPPEVLEMVTDRFCEPSILLSHSHIQYRIQHHGTEIINPGSVGQTRLGTKEAAYAILQDGRFDLRGVLYDIEKTCRQMDRIPMPDDFREAWKDGYRRGVLPEFYKIRNWNELKSKGYR